MGLRINTNTQSIAAQRHLGTNNRAQQQSLEKMSSGTRISRAADDAAGLAISENMRASIRSIQQDSRNANDGISLIQTAEGGMNEIGNILIRFRELSIQAATDTLTDVERGFIDKEVQQLHAEVDRISESTQFNGRKILSGQEEEVLEIQVGQGNDEAIDRFKVDLGKINVSTLSLGLEEFNTKTKEAAQMNLSKIDGAIRKLSENRADMGALQNRLQSTIANLDIYNENLSAARSRIYDVDMASETAELTKRNILSQAGVSVLSQANTNNTLALKLI